MITKRQLGIFIIALSVLGILAVLGADLLGLSRWSGFGPLQQIGIGLASGAILVGLILVRLGDRPA